MNLFRMSLTLCACALIAFSCQACQPPIAILATSKVLCKKVGETFTIDMPGPNVRHHVSETINIKNDCVQELTKKHEKRYEMAPGANHVCMFTAKNPGYVHLVLAFEQFCREHHFFHHITSVHYHILVS